MKFIRRVWFIILCLTALPVCYVLLSSLLTFTSTSASKRTGRKALALTPTVASERVPSKAPTEPPAPGMLLSDGFVRNCVTGSIIGKTPVTVNRSRLMMMSSGDDDQRAPARQELFKRIFKTKYWGEHDKSYTGLSASGDGSTIRYAQETIAALHILATMLKQHSGMPRIRLVDLSCGDMQWMSRFLETRDDIDYTGFDIVPDLIEHHRKQFADKPWKFEHHDMVNDNTTMKQFDIILSRHTFMHMTTPDVVKVLTRLSKEDDGQLRFLLTTTFSRNEPLAQYRDISTTRGGGYRRLNLEVPPISLVPPLCLIHDGFLGKKQFLGLWQLPLDVVKDCTTAVAFKTPFGKMQSCVDWSLKNPSP